MNQSPLLTDLRRLSQGRGSDAASDAFGVSQQDIVDYIASLTSPHEIWAILITNNALRTLINSDIDKVAVIWKSTYIKSFIDNAWVKGAPADKQAYPVSTSRWKTRFRAMAFSMKSLNYQPRLVWASHLLYNIAFYILLALFVYSPSLLVEFPHPLEIALSVVFLIPSLFPPYTPAFLGYLAIDIIFLISFIFRAIAFKNWPYISFDTVILLLNARTLVAFLPLIQIANVILLAFPLPRLLLLKRLFYPGLPIAVGMFTGFFLTLHFLSDNHSSVRHSFDTLLRTVLLDSHSGEMTQFHPIAARIVYYLFAFSSLYLFWGMGIAGVGMKVVQETDWHAERMRWEAVQLLRCLRDEKPVRKKRLLGRGKVLAAMPFNILDGIGVMFRLRWLRNLAVYFSMFPIVVGWSLGLGFYKCGFCVWIWMKTVGNKILDEVEDEVAVETDGDSDGDVNETSRLLS